MLHRDETVWAVVNHTTLSDKGEMRWEMVGISGSPTNADECYGKFVKDMVCHSCYQLAWTWRHGWLVIQCQGGDLIGRTMEHIVHDGSCKELDDLLWSELIGWQHRHETVTVA